MAIKRIWHGWTTPENADVYERFLHDEAFPGIEAKNIAAYRSIELLRRDRYLALAQRLGASTSGATALEYTIIAALLSIVIVGGVALIGGTVADLFNAAANAF